MPYQWTTTNDTEQLIAWPHKSLSSNGFVTFIAITCAMLLLPLLAVLGSPILWGLLPFLAGTVALTWYFLRRSNKDRDIREVLRLTPTDLTLTRSTPTTSDQTWQANPYWTRLSLYKTGGPVEQYLTLSGAGSEVELGAFLSIQERERLHDELAARLHRMNINAPAKPH